jgi:hypothetical protein
VRGRKAGGGGGGTELLEDTLALIEEGRD